MFRERLDDELGYFPRELIRFFHEEFNRRMEARCLSISACPGTVIPNIDLPLLLSLYYLS